MALEPIVTWKQYDTDGVTVIDLNAWNLGTVEAAGNSDLTIKRFIVWNNYNRSEAVQTMRGVKVGTRDTTGGFNLPLVKENWVKGKYPTAASIWTDIGAMENTGTWVANEMSVSAVGAVETGTIQGNINNGTMGVGNDKNYTIFDLKISVPATASAGGVSAKLRMGYDITG